MMVRSVSSTPEQESLVDLVGLGHLAGGRVVRRDLHRPGVGAAGQDRPLPRDVTLERVTAPILVDHLLFGDLRQEGEQRIDRREIADGRYWPPGSS